jgi:photosystem II stability/assembly factor-like uncharacterized protein
MDIPREPKEKRPRRGSGRPRHPPRGRATAGAHASGARTRRPPVRLRTPKKVPGGKALARTRLFALQRGLPPLQAHRGAVRGDAGRVGASRVGAGRVVASRAGSRRERTAGTERTAASPHLPYLDAFTQKRALAAHAAPAGGGPGVGQPPRWRELGPTSIPHGQTYGHGANSQPPVSGRIASVAVDPADTRHVLIASAGGGLWETRDLGGTWRPLTDDLPTLAMGALAFAPSDPRIVYAGTGEGDSLVPLGVGLLRSRDGGASWAVLPFAELVGQAFYDLIVDPADADHVWAATTAGLYESLDGGASWQRQRTHLTWDLSLDPRTNELLAGCQDGLVRSTNGGATWKRLALPEMPAGEIARMEVCHAPSDGGIAYVFASIDGLARLWRRCAPGAAFVRQSLPRGLKTDQAWYDWCAAVVPDDPDTVFIGAIELYRGRRRAKGSWDWSNISSRRRGDSIHPDQHHLAFAPDDSRVVYSTNDGGLFRSPDLGRTWQSLNKGLAITEFEFLAQHPTQLDWILGGTQDNGTLRRALGTQWDQVALGDGGDCGVDTAHPQVCYHTYYEMGVEVSPDGGSKWKDIGPWVSEDYACLFYPPVEVLGRVVAQAGETVLITETQGKLWAEVALQGVGRNAQLASALAIPGPGEILVGTDAGRVYRILRDTSGWDGVAAVRLTTPRDGFVSDIHVDPRGRIWVSYSTIQGGHLFVSTDGGASWAERSGGLPSVPVNAVAVDPARPDTLYVGTDNGVYRSPDSGSTWAEYGLGLPNAVVGDVVLHASGRRLRAGMRNRGVWEINI